MSTADCAPPQSGSRQLCLLLLGRSERQHSPLRSLPKAPLWQHAARCKGVERKRWESIRLGILRLSGFVNSANVARVPGAISARELGVRQTIHPETVILRATPSSRHLGCVSCVWPVHPSLATLLLSANMTTTDCPAANRLALSSSNFSEERKSGEEKKQLPPSPSCRLSLRPP